VGSIGSAARGPAALLVSHAVASPIPAPALLHRFYAGRQMSLLQNAYQLFKMG
jgi:hypothetical protein